MGDDLTRKETILRMGAERRAENPGDRPDHGHPARFVDFEVYVQALRERDHARLAAAAWTVVAIGMTGLLGICLSMGG